MAVLTLPFQSMPLSLHSLTTRTRVPSISLSTSLECEPLCFVPGAERDASDVSPLGHRTSRYLGAAYLCSLWVPILLC